MELALLLAFISQMGKGNSFIFSVYVELLIICTLNVCVLTFMHVFMCVDLSVYAYTQMHRVTYKTILCNTSFCNNLSLSESSIIIILFKIKLPTKHAFTFSYRKC